MGPCCQRATHHLNNTLVCLEISMWPLWPTTQLNTTQSHYWKSGLLRRDGQLRLHISFSFQSVIFMATLKHLNVFLLPRTLCHELFPVFLLQTLHLDEWSAQYIPHTLLSKLFCMNSGRCAQSFHRSDNSSFLDKKDWWQSSTLTKSSSYHCK